MPMRRLWPPASAAALSGARATGSIVHLCRSCRAQSQDWPYPIAHHYNPAATSRVAAVGPGSTPVGVLPMDQVTTYRTSSGQHLWRMRRGAVLVFGPLPP